MVEIEIPKHYGPKMRDELNSSSTLNLRDYSHYFFDVGLKLSLMTKDEDLRKTLRTSFSGDRFKALIADALTKLVTMTMFAYEMLIFDIIFPNFLTQSSRRYSRVHTDINSNRTIVVYGRLFNLKYQINYIYLHISLNFIGYKVSKELFKWRCRQSNRLLAAPILGKKLIVDRENTNSSKRSRND